MVVPLVVPSTRTLSPGLIELAEIEAVPLRYFVEDTVLTVTFCPAAVVSVKLDVETAAILPTAPPAAGPERALDPRGPGAPWSAAGVGEAAVVVVLALVLAVALTIP